MEFIMCLLTLMKSIGVIFIIPAAIILVIAIIVKKNRSYDRKKGMR